MECRRVWGGGNTVKDRKKKKRKHSETKSNKKYKSV